MSKRETERGGSTDHLGVVLAEFIASWNDGEADVGVVDALLLMK